MRVLMINTVDTARNGITNVVFHCVDVMRVHDMSFDLLAINMPDSDYVDAIERTGGTVFVVPRRMKHLVRYFLALVRLVRENEYSIVHIHGNSATCTIEAVAVKFARVSKIVMHAHSSSCRHRFLHRMLRPLLNRMIDERLACSSAAGSFLFGKRKYHILNNAIDSSKYRYHESWRRQIRSAHGIGQHALVVGHVGTFSNVKNHAFLIRVFFELHKVKDDAVLVLIGEGENEQEVRQQIRDLSLDDYVILTGAVNNVAEYMSAFDCFVLPSHFEGMPLVLMEAQASGLPCVVSDAVQRNANVSGNVMFLGLRQSEKAWSEQILLCTGQGRREQRSCDAVQSIVSSGYDVTGIGEYLAAAYARVTGSAAAQTATDVNKQP